MRVDDIRGELRGRGISGISGQRKDELVKTLVKTLRAEQRRATAQAKKTAPATKSVATKKAAPTKKSVAAKAPSKRGRENGAGGGTSQGRSSSRSLRYAQRISSVEEHPERPGRSLVTANQEVIRRWAQARNAVPATIEGTQRDGRPGVLTFDFPGYREGGRLRKITWDDWFGTFSGRGLNFLYQEQTSNRRQSNFFRLESPEREDA